MVLYSLSVDESRCMNCGACMDLCPSTCIEFTKPDDVSFYGALMGGSAPKSWMMEKPYLIGQERCTGCMICVRECPTNAIAIEPDATKPATLRPKPVIVRKEGVADDGYWHPLSEYTRDFLKRPVRSPWSRLSSWKPMTKPAPPNQVWRSMGTDEQPTE